MIIKVMRRREHDTSQPHEHVGNFEIEQVPNAGQRLVIGERVLFVQDVYWFLKEHRVEVWTVRAVAT